MLFSASACKLAMVDVCEYLAFLFRYESRKEWEDMPYQAWACSFIDYDWTDCTPQFPPLDDE